jgi:predicted membrane protein
METNNRFIDRRAILGIVLVLLGVLVLADNLNWFSFSLFDIIFSFPMILIIVGLISLNHKRNNVLSYIIIGLGIVLITPRILNIPFDYHRLFLPAVFVTIGLLILFRKKKDHNFCVSEPTESSADYLDEMNVFGGSERKITTKSFKGGRITSIFGGSSYDMRDCELADGKNLIDVVNIFGGTKMLIPADWKIHVEVVSIFGGFSDKRNKYNSPVVESGKELHITGFVIFGGGEIKSF